MRASDCTDTLPATSPRSAVFLRWTFAPTVRLEEPAHMAAPSTSIGLNYWMGLG
jgi:hypothetical protein